VRDATSFGMDDRERLTIDQTQGHPTLLTVILPVIDP
jgi:hypothetical protein